VLLLRARLYETNATRTTRTGFKTKKRSLKTRWQTRNYIVLYLVSSSRSEPEHGDGLLLTCMGGFTCLCVHTHGPCLLPGERRGCLLAGLQDCKQMDCRCMARLGSLTEACRGASDGTQMMIGSISTDARTKGGYGYRC